MEGSRKKSAPSHVSIERAKNGGYVVKHSFDNLGAGESYRPSETHAFADHASMMAHVHTSTGRVSAVSDGDAEEVAGVRAAPAKGKGPTVRSAGAGLD